VVSLDCREDRKLAAADRLLAARIGAPMFISISRTPVRTLTAVLLMTSAGLIATPSTAGAASGSFTAPVVGADRAGAIDGEYIVVIKAKAPSSARTEARRQAVKQGGQIRFDYTAALKGFAATLPDRAIEALRHNPNVAYIEADSRVSIDTTQTPATWGLDRIDQRNLPLNNAYNYDFTGTGVTAYIIDTGIRGTHTQFGGRVLSGFTSVSDGNGTNDCNGHGTHVAGTVGSSTYGVAKSVTLRPVRVLNCSGSGSNSGVIAGIDWVTGQHAAGAPAVANMSLGGSVSSSLDTAVNNSIADGVTYAVAAGNSNTNACNGSPSRVAAALTVGSTTSSDARSSFSNYGSCLDLFAPGSSITSTWSTSDTATNTISGTSMATPHVAGVAALYLQANPNASPASVSSAINSNATPNVVTGAGTGSPNRLLHSLFGATPPPPPPPPPPPGGNLLVNPGFESGATGWSATAGVINSGSTNARSGSGYAWLDGYGSSHTDTLAQTVAIPAASSATLSFWLKITSSETTTTVQYDKLTVQVISGGVTSTLATYSNLNKGSTYVQRSFNVSAYVGKTVTIKFTGTEDYSLATSFFIDDTSLTAS
jgi:subtilisin family serine protease